MFTHKDPIDLTYVDNVAVMSISFYGVKATMKTVNASSALISAKFKVSWQKRAKGGVTGEGERHGWRRRGSSTGGKLGRRGGGRGGDYMRKKPWGNPHCGWPQGMERNKLTCLHIQGN